MPRVPASFPGGLLCDPRLPAAALTYRRTSNPQLLSLQDLGALNVTARLYRDAEGVERIQVNPNVTIAELRKQFGPAATRDAEVGIHSEARAAEFFRVNPRFRVLKIFSERIPCAKMCAPLLRHYFPGIPWFYYYDRRSWRGTDGELVRKAAEALTAAYQL